MVIAGARDATRAFAESGVEEVHLDVFTGPILVMCIFMGCTLAVLCNVVLAQQPGNEE